MQNNNDLLILCWVENVVSIYGQIEIGVTREQ